MKDFCKLGFTLCMTLVILFSGCKKDDDFEPVNNRKLLSELCVYTEYGRVGHTRTEYQYDARGRCVGKNTFDDINGELSSVKFEYEYDDCDRLTKDEYTCFEGESISYHSIETYKFDENGNQTENTTIRIYYMEEDYSEWKQTWEYEYDEQGNIIKYVSYENGRIRDEREYTYNENVVNYTGTEYYYDDGYTFYPDCVKEEYSAKEEYLYVNNRKLLKVFSYESNFETREKLYEYDKEGNTISYECYVDGEPNEKWYYEGNTYYYARYSNNCVVDARKIVYTNSKRERKLTEEKDNSSERGGATSMCKYKYDSRGRLKGYEYYVGGRLMNEYKDYVYDGNKVTYTEYSYWGNDTGIRCHTLIYVD